MAGLIPQTFIDDLLDRVDIVDVVDARVKLKKSGKNYSACCPFHDEKTPSFTVSPDKQFYYCFGCGASGNAIGFVIDYDRLSFPEAVEQIARQCGLEVPRETREVSPRARDRKNIYTQLEKADRFYRQQLRRHSSRSAAVNYLKGRGLNGEIARDFGIGYAPPGWDNLLRELGRNTEDRRLLIEGGMLINREEDQKCYDRFRHRIMFPIRDLRGRVIGFGGRVLSDDAQGRASAAGGRMPGVTDAQGRASAAGGKKPPGVAQPKYLNSPETPVFCKGRELYGLYEARRAYRQLPRLLVVEGYMDVVALAQFGIRYAVATLGTACGEEHLNSAFRYTTEVVFCFDGDNAGRAAARRALEHALPAMQDGRQVKFLFLPEGEDPDTLVRKLGTDPFTRLIENAVPIEDFLFETVSQGIDIQFMEGRARLSKLAAPLLGRLPKGVFRELMFNSLASRTGLNVETLLELVDEAPGPRLNRAGPAEQVEPGSAVSVAGHQPATGDAYEPLPPEYPDEYLAEESYRKSYGEPRPRLAPRPGKAHRAGGPQIKLPLEKRVAALLLQHPELAAGVQQPQSLLTGEGPDLAVLLSLVELLQQRPHYTISRILGYWRATYGARATDELAQLAASQLLHSARQFGYDPTAEFRDALNKIRARQEKLRQRSVLEKLKHKAFNDVSAEEKQTVKDVYASRSIPPE